MQALFASTASGLEELLKNELIALGAQDCRLTEGGVYFLADQPVIYTCLLWSRFASRIFLLLQREKINDIEDLYALSCTIDWVSIFDLDKTFAVYFKGSNNFIRNSQFGALKIKDAIVDSFMSHFQQRPQVDKQSPAIRITAFLRGNTLTIMLDLSGVALHQRGYRYEVGAAPIKETLAAAIVKRSGWQADTPLIDPMCGSGTLLIEAALMLCDQAPGLLRQEWGFTAWKGHKIEMWQQAVKIAQLRADESKKHCSRRLIYGFDRDPNIIKIAYRNAQRAGLAEWIQLQTVDVSQFKKPNDIEQIGTVVSNPPYGERLESQTTLTALYNTLGRLMKSQFPGWHLSLFSATPELLDCLQLRAERQFKAKNGALECIQKNYTLSTRANDDGQVISEIAVDFANRLRKNLNKVTKWANKEQLECYRIYDADLPEYNVAIDRYADYVVIQEYAPPKNIDPIKARGRLLDLIAATQQVLSLTPQQIAIKTRQRTSGKTQYQKLSQQNEYLEVFEYGAKFLVNLTDYLDTGLFLDHRLVRKKLGELAKGKDFLNLFCYTATATVQAGLGGAKSTTSVDMSKTYLMWAERNLQLNRLLGYKHCLIQADCLVWLKDCKKQFDLIFIDPPTFSNSKRMHTTFDVQRDYLVILALAKPLLRREGSLIFSNNKRGFKIDIEQLSHVGFSVKEITKQTISFDFSRNQYVHRCWLLQHNS